MTKEFYSTAEVAHLLDVRVHTVVREINRGRLAAVKFGGQFRVPREELDRLRGEAVARVGGADVDGFPRAYVISAEKNPDYPGSSIVTVGCPLCPDTHRHGSDAGFRGKVGHKVRHCVPDRLYNLDSPNGYVVWDLRPASEL